MYICRHLGLECGEELCIHWCYSMHFVSPYIYLLYFAWANQSAASAVSVIQHGLRGARAIQHDSRHVIAVIVLAFLTQENKAGKMQSTINQLKHGKGRAVRAIMVLGVVSIDHTALGYTSCCMAISTTPLVPLLHVQHFLPCFN